MPAVTHENLTLYLNDHLAGSVAALELIDHLIETAGENAAEAQFFRQLRADIEADQNVLKQLITHFGGEESSVRKAAGWLAEKLGRAKLKLDGGGTSEALGRFQALEGLVLGITGKRALWQALAAADLRANVNLPELIRRAEAQRDAVEEWRRRAAVAALTS